MRKAAGSKCVRWAGPIAIAVSIATGVPAWSQSTTDPKSAPTAAKGAELAGKLCSGCHLMEGHASASIPAGVISMRGIANRKGQTGRRILDMLIQPHPPMPDIRLSVEEINSVILYLETLRTDQSVPPLIEEEKKRERPKYPQPG